MIMAQGGKSLYLRQYIRDDYMIKVMIIEDDPMVREINKRFLSRLEGFRVVAEAADIKPAKEIILQTEIDLILLDVFLPSGRGLDLLKWLRANEKDTDVILITADKSTESVSEALRYGAMDYLVKPFKFQRFEEALLRYKRMKAKLETRNEMNQETIDSLTKKAGRLNSNDMDILLDDEFKNQTYNKILSFIMEHKDSYFSAAEIGMALGISRITARKYLDELEKEERVIMEPEYGSVGRPQNKYRWNSNSPNSK